MKPLAELEMEPVISPQVPEKPSNMVTRTWLISLAVAITVAVAAVVILLTQGTRKPLTTFSHNVSTSATPDRTIHITGTTEAVRMRNRSGAFD